MSTPTLRVFISSPGDVKAERARAKLVIEQLTKQYAGRVTLVPVFWEDLPLGAEASFQEGIDLVLTTYRIDIAVFILWSRLGSPLGSQIVRADGSRYRSGTEREFDLMLAAREASREDRPTLIAYFRKDDSAFELSQSGQSDEQKIEMLHQKVAAKRFVEERFYDAETGTNVRAFHDYGKPIEFAERLRVHLRGAVDEMVGDELGAVRWTGVPFRGLEAFGVRHAGIFFGREQEVADVVLALDTRAREGCGAVLVVGASGAGKSSLVRAGVIPALVNYDTDPDVAGWRYAIVEPGASAPRFLQGLALALATPPALGSGLVEVDDLAGALGEQPEAAYRLALLPALRRHDDGERPARLLVFVDQLEELFTLGRGHEASVRAFLRALRVLAETDRVRVVATVRSDFYAQCQAHPDLLAMRQGAGLFDLLPPTTSALQRIITGPARLAGLSFEANDRTGRTLDQQILDDASSQPHALPLLQYALRELFEARTEAGGLTYARYEALGGVVGAVSRRAEEVFAGLSPAAQDSLGEVLNELVTVSEHDEASVARQQAPRARLEGSPGRREVVRRFVEERLFVTDRDDAGRPVVTVAHEALLHLWGRAQAWVEANRAFLAGRARLQQDLERWRRERERDDFLIAAGKPLEDAKALLSVGAERLTEAQRTFVARSAEHHDARRQERLRRLEAERDRARTAERTAARNFSLAVQATDGLAVGIAREIEQNFEVPTHEKLFLAGHLTRSLDALREDVTGASGLLTRSADLQARLAFAFAEVLRLDEARAHAASAARLLAVSRAADVPREPLVAARVRLAAALDRRYDWQPHEAQRRLGEAAALLSEATPAPEGAAPAAHDEADVLRARIASARADLLYHRTDSFESERVARAGIDLIRAALAPRSERAPGDLTVRALDHALLRLHDTWFRCMDRTGRQRDSRPLLDSLERALEATHGRAQAGWTPRWDAADATRHRIRAVLGDGPDSLDALTLAVGKLHRVMLDDVDNLRWRRALCAALLQRVAAADAVDDKAQAEADLRAVRTLIVSLRRDSRNDTVAFQLACQADYREAGRAEGKRADETLGRMRARLARHRERYGVQPQTGRNEVFAHLLAVHQHAGSKKKQTGAWKVAQEALDTLDALEEGDGGAADRAGLRLAVVLPILGADADAVDRAAWDEAMAVAWASVKRMREELGPSEEGRPRASHEAGLLDFYTATRLLSDEAPREAAAAFLRAADSFGEEGPHSATAVGNHLLCLRRAAEVYQDSGAQKRVLDVASRAHRFLDQAVLPPGAPEWGHVRALVDLLANDVRAPEGTSGEAEGEAAALLPRLEQIREALVRHIDAAARSAREAADAPGPDRPAGGDDRFDLRELELGALRTGEQDGHLLVRDRLGWASRTTYPGPWRTLVGDEFEAAAEHVGAMWEREAVPERVRVCALPFYPGGLLYEAEYDDPDRGAEAVAVLEVDGVRYKLNGTSPPIHQCNAKAPIELSTEGEAAAYVRFFGSYVAGGAGAFQLVEETEDLAWMPTAPPEARAAVARLLRPLVVWSDPEREGWWRATATVQYANGLFHAAFALQPTGMVEMLKDKQVALSPFLNPPRYEGGARRAGRIDTVDLTALGARTFQQANEEAGLLRLAKEVHDARPDHARALMLEAADLALAQEDTATALKVRAALEARGAYEDAYALQDRLTARARHAYEEADRGRPASRRQAVALADALADLARLAARRGKGSSALEHAREALALAPDRASVRDAVEGLLAEVEPSDEATPLRARLRDTVPPAETPAEAPAEAPGAGARLFERCEFLLGEDDVLIIVVPATLPGDVTVYVTPDVLFFVADGRLVAEVPYSADEAARRLDRLEQVGLTEHEPGAPLPDVVTKVATVEHGPPPPAAWRRA